MLKIPCNCAMMIVACIIVKYGTKMEIKNLTTSVSSLCTVSVRCVQCQFAVYSVQFAVYSVSSLCTVVEEGSSPSTKVSCSCYVGLFPRSVVSCLVLSLSHLVILSRLMLTIQMALIPPAPPSPAGVVTRVRLEITLTIPVFSAVGRIPRQSGSVRKPSRKSTPLTT
jgi:hypothetical protein